jgi:hypothetical protein
MKPEIFEIFFRFLPGSLPDAAAKGKIWSDTKEVYFLP